MKISVDARLKLTFDNNLAFHLNPDQVYGLALYLTGQGWGVGEGLVRYMGSLATPITIKYPDNEYPSMTFENFMVDCDGRYSDEASIFVMEGDLRASFSRKALLKELEKFLVQHVSTLLVFPEISDKDEDYPTSESIFTPKMIKVSETVHGEDVNLAVWHEINHVVGNTQVVGLYVFTTNQSVPRPAKVRKIVLLMKSNNNQEG